MVSIRWNWSLAPSFETSLGYRIRWLSFASSSRSIFRVAPHPPPHLILVPTAAILPTSKFPRYACMFLPESLCTHPSLHLKCSSLKFTQSHQPPIIHHPYVHVYVICVYTCPYTHIETTGECQMPCSIIVQYQVVKHLPRMQEFLSTTQHRCDGICLWSQLPR